jgi:multiple sugar transport system substrate-binding protein
MIRKFRFLSSLLLLLTLLSGCGNLPANLPFLNATPTATGTPVTTPTSGPSPTSQPATPSRPDSLRLWVPPQFDPNADTDAGKLFKARLDDFASRNPGLIIDVRVKAVSGPANLLDELLLTQSAAPEALPDLIALPRDDLETGALKGALHPFDGLSEILNDPDWYTYARQLGHVKNTAYGLPFAGDALLLLYHPSLLGQLPDTWEGMQSQGVTLSIPGADPAATFELCLYQSTGVKLVDEQGNPKLDQGTLTTLFAFLRANQQNGMIPFNVTEYQNDTQSWQAYSDGFANTVVTWSSRYLTDTPADTLPAPLLGLDGTAYTVATGWSWALAGSNPSRQALAVKLAEFLVDSEFLAGWTSATGVLPTRPNALAAWPDKTQQANLNAIMLSAQLAPSEEVTTTLGPVIEEAGLKVLNGQQTPEEAAQAVVDSLK